MDRDREKSTKRIKISQWRQNSSRSPKPERKGNASLDPEREKEFIKAFQTFDLDGNYVFLFEVFGVQIHPILRHVLIGISAQGFYR